MALITNQTKKYLIKITLTNFINKIKTIEITPIVGTNIDFKSTIKANMFNDVFKEITNSTDLSTSNPSNIKLFNLEFRDRYFDFIEISKFIKANISR